MLRPHDVQRLVDRVRYKPFFKIFVRDMGYEVLISLTLTTQDANALTQDRLICVTMPFTLTYEMLMIMDERAFYENLRENIRKLEYHEVDEWLRVDEVKVYDPHVDDMTLRERQRALDVIFPR